ncbi:MAG: hypothetical protein H0U76_28425 [Ktedonobacteraceae bacterium]|nr:hypothetical protein [Ktedonobacteraceae bacterium]
MYPVILVIDADEMRAQRMGRLLTLTGYRPFLVARPYDAFERALQEGIFPEAILLGQSDITSHYLFQRLLQHLAQLSNKQIPLLLLPALIVDTVPLLADPSSLSFHLLSKACIEVLRPLWKNSSLPSNDLRIQQQAFVLTVLPAHEIQPRISRRLHSRNSHFRQILKAAHELIGDEQWQSIITDVGLAHYCQVDNWPADNDERAISAEYLSYLNQAVAFSKPGDPASQLRLWGDYATALSLQKRTPSALTQQVLKLLPMDRTISAVLNAFTQEMNEIRGEELHLWRRQPDGSYWLVHYSNLYAYGRTSATQPACHVWEASLARTFRLVGLDAMLEVRESECSCQTLTGHCLFVITPR